jgi:hypothetical protein
VRPRILASSICFFLGLALVVTACGHDQPDHRDIPSIDALDPSWDLSVAGDTQRSALMDGEITRREYIDGFNAFESCMNEEGFQLTSEREVAGIFEFSIPDAAVKSGVDQRCYLTHFMFVDATWQYENSEERVFIERVNRCLGLDEDRSFAALTTRGEAEEALAEAGRQISECP